MPIPNRSRSVIPLAELERVAIQEAIQVTLGDKQEAARLLGIGKTTLYRKLREYEGGGSQGRGVTNQPAVRENGTP